jgi:hypothetical protein
LPPHFPFIEEDDLSLKSFSGKHAQFSRRFRMRDARQTAVKNKKFYTPFVQNI